MTSVRSRAHRRSSAGGGVGTLSGWAPPDLDTGAFDFGRTSGGFGFATVAKLSKKREPERNEGSAGPTREELEADWKAWLKHFFFDYVSDDDGNFIEFAPHHAQFWEHVWSIEKGERIPPYLSVWPRGQAKSTSVELACVALGARGKRLYVLYVCGTQDQADDHVANVGDMLGSETIAEHYPKLSERKVGKYGSSAGWRRNRLRTDAGFTIDAVGLDTLSIRGKKLGSERPDVIVFDDIDDEADSEKTVLKKIRTLTRKIIPAGAPDLTVFGAQNLVHENAVFQKLVDKTAGFLTDAVISGPVPALEDFEYLEHDDGRVEIVSGTPTWPEGMDLERCAQIIIDEGLEAFLVEYQHLTDAPQGNLVYRRSRVDAAIKRGDEVEYDPQALQILTLDPGYQKRACLLAIQEGAGDRIELWKEWSFTRCDDDYIARVAAEHCLNYNVKHFYYDAESPEQAAAVKKHLRKLARERGLRRKNIPTRFSKVAFGLYKRYAIAITRWLLNGPTVAWGAKVTDVHVGDRFKGEEPGMFRKETRGYKLDPAKEDVPEKQNDHGPDAWHAYAPRWLKVWLRDTNQKRSVRELVEDAA